MNEKLAFTAYERMAAVLVASGEQDLAESLMRPLRRDESAHLGYYRTVARDLRERLDRWQLAAARALIVRTYAPVGAGAASDEPAFGRTVRALSPRPDADDLPGAVQRIAESLLSRDGRSLPPFRPAVGRRLRGRPRRRRAGPRRAHRRRSCGRPGRRVNAATDRGRV